MWRRFRRIAALAAVALLVVVIAVLAADGLIIGTSLRSITQTAQTRFPGNRAEALIALVNCQSCDRHDRNNAVWALGQLDDPRALPILETRYAENHGAPLDREKLQIALRHLRHEDGNRGEAFLWRWMLPNES